MPVTICTKEIILNANRLGETCHMLSLFQVAGISTWRTLGEKGWSMNIWNTCVVVHTCMLDYSFPRESDEFVSILCLAENHSNHVSTLEWPTPLSHFSLKWMIVKYNGRSHLSQNYFSLLPSLVQILVTKYYSSNLNNCSKINWHTKDQLRLWVEIRVCTSLNPIQSETNNLFRQVFH